MPNWWRHVIICNTKDEKHNIRSSVYINLKQKNSPVDFCNCKSQDIYSSFMNTTTEKRNPIVLIVEKHAHTDTRTHARRHHTHTYIYIYILNEDKCSHIFQVPFKSWRETSFQKSIIHRILSSNNWQ